MNLVVIAAVIAVCGAAKLDRTYLPPASAKTAGGSPGSLQTPLTRSSEEGLETPALPTGSFTNNFQGVVVEAAAPGTRASADAELSGLGGPRPSYGSTDSKVGDAAFRGSVAGFRGAPTSGSAPTLETSGQIAGGFSSNGQGNSAQNLQGFLSNEASTDENKSERPQATKDRNSNILNFNNDVSSDNYSYGFETDNGIAVGENGVAANGIQAEGGYSYKGDDGQVYKITYTADKGGFRPQGNHLPTPPPIPEEIKKSLEKNAKEEAAGHVDDGSYDAQKYNTDGDYTHDTIAIGGNNQYNGAQLPQFGKRPESDATVSGTINQNSQAFGKPGNSGSGNYNTYSSINGQTSHGDFGSAQYGKGSEQNSHAAFNGQSQGNGFSESANFGTGANAQSSHSAFNGQSQENGVSGSSDFGTGANAQSSHSAFNGQSQGNGVSESANFGTGANAQSSHSAFNGQSQGNGVSESANFGTGANAQSSHSAFNGQSQGNGVSGLASFGTGANAQSSHSAFNGQSQGNGVSGSPNFGTGANAQSFNSAFNGQSQGNGVSGLASFGTGANAQSSHSAFNGQSQGNGVSGSPNFGTGANAQSSHLAFNGQSQGNGNSGSAQFGHGSIAQNSQSTINGQSNQGNQYHSSSHLSQNTQTSHFSQQNGHENSGNSGNGISHGSQINQLGPTSGQSGIKSPSGSQNNEQGLISQFGSKPSKPAFGQNAGNIGSNSGTTQTQFGSQSTNGLAGASSYQNTQGIPSKYNKPGQTQFGTGNYKQPISEQSQANQFGSSTNSFNKFPQTQGNFGTNNEYLPPLNSLSPGSNSNFGSSGSSVSGSNSGQKPVENEQTPSSIGQTAGASSASPAASFGKPASKPQSTQFNYNSQQAPQTVPGNSLKPTAVPNTELTTPLEPNESHSASNSQFSGQSTSFGSKPFNQQTQTQFGFQGSQQSSQTLSPSYPTSSPQISSNSQYGSTSIQSTIPASSGNKPDSTIKPQFPQNSFSNKPSYNQVTDRPYQYNHPSKPFSSPAVRPQGSGFPSSSSYYPNGVASQNQFNQQSSFQNSNQLSGSPSLAPVAPTSATQFTQTQGSSNYNGITQAAVSPFPSPVPTSSQFGTALNGQFGSKPTFNQQSTINNQFIAGNQQNNPAFSQQPTGQQSFPSRPITQFGQKPTQPQSQLFGQNKPTPGLPGSLSQEQTSGTQQYQGTIYQYNKPTEAQTAPTGQKPTQFGQGETKPESSGSSYQQQTTGTQQYQGTVYQYNKPAEVHTPQSGQKPTQFGQGETKPESSSSSFQQQTTGTQQYQGTIYQYNKPAVVLPAPTPDSSSSQTIQTSLTQGSFGSQTNKPFGNYQSNAQFGLNKPTGYGSSLSHQTTGTQFSAQPTTQSQFGQATQSAQDSSSSTQINQQTTQPNAFKPFGGASQGVQPAFGSKPQFGSQAQLTQPLGSSQTVQPGQGSGSQSQLSSQTTTQSLHSSTQLNQQTTQQNAFKPFGGGSQGVQSVFGSKPQFGSQAQLTQPLGGSQTVQPGQGSGPQSQLSSQTTTQSLHSSTQLNQQTTHQNAFKPFGGGSQGVQSAFGSKPQFGSQAQLTQPLGGSQTVQPGQGSGPQSQLSSQTTTQSLHSSTQLNQQSNQPNAFKPFGVASQGVQSAFGSKPQFGSQAQLTQPLGSSQTVQPGQGSEPQSQLSSQTFGNAVSSQDNGYVYPKNPQPQFVESSQNLFGQSFAFGKRPGTTQFSQNFPSPASQLPASFNKQPSQTQFSSKPQFGTQSQTQFGQNAQTPFGQKTNSPFGQPQLGQVSSQVITSGQASASASASNKPQAYKPFGQSDSQGSQIGAQNSKPCDRNGQKTSNSKPYGALNLSPFGVNESADVPNPLLGSDSTSSQSTVRPSVAGQDQISFQGAQNFNALSFVGKGEEFSGPRQPPRFDDNTGYHY